MPKKDMRELLNLSYTQLTNLGQCSGILDLPNLECNPFTLPNYVALYDEPGYYHKTDSTCVAFYRYDCQFDGINGLFNAIYYNDQKLLRKYQERFKGIRFFVSPDYSQCGDVHSAENHYRLFKARIVSLWLSIRMGAVVIPNLTYAKEDEIDLALDGLEECSVIALSTKGSMRNPKDAELLLRSLSRATERLPLKAVVVYTSSLNDEWITRTLGGIVKSGTSIVIPDNAHREIKRRSTGAR